MDHETTAPLLSDLLAGRLAPDRSGEAWSHVGTCHDCRSVATTMRQVRQAAASDQGTAWGEHPRAENLVDYALDDGELSGSARARVDDHVRTCLSCLRHIRLTREAHLSVLSQAGGTRFADRFSPTLAWAAALVMVALLGALALPAYRGLVALPEAQRARQDLARQVGSLRHEESVLRRALQAHEEERSRLQSGGGAVALLYLGDTARGPGASPSVTLRPGQLFQPIVLDPESVALSSHQEVALSLRRLPEGAEAWTYRAAWGQLWDPESRTLTLLLPAAALTPGEYRLDLRQPGRPQPLYTARFSVRPAARRSP